MERWLWMLMKGRTFIGQPHFRCDFDQTEKLITSVCRYSMANALTSALAKVSRKAYHKLGESQLSDPL